MQVESLFDSPPTNNSYLSVSMRIDIEAYLPVLLLSKSFPIINPFRRIVPSIARPLFIHFFISDFERQFLNNSTLLFSETGF